MDALGALLAQRQMNQQGVQNLIGTMQGWAKQNRLKNLSQAFFEHGDFTPEGIQKFAEKNKLTIPEMIGVVQVMQKFNEYAKSKQPKKYQVSWIDEKGNSHTGLKTEAEIGGGLLTGLAKKEALVDVPGYGRMPVSQGYHYLDKETKPDYKVYKNIQTGKSKRIDLNKETPPDGINWVSINKYSGPDKNKPKPKEILDTSIKVLKSRLPAGNIFTDLAVEDMMDPNNKQTYIQMFQEALKSNDLLVRKAALKGLKAMKEILGISDEELKPKPKIVNPSASNMPEGEFDYVDGIFRKTKAK